MIQIKLKKDDEIVREYIVNSHVTIDTQGIDKVEVTDPDKVTIEE